jgi:outer membrane receptor for ferrienterochelin and colicin
VNAYRRFTTDKIEYISSFSDNVRVYSPENVGTADTKGLELNFKYTPYNKITFNGDLNYNYFIREGIFNEESFDFNNDYWSTKITSKYKVNKNLDMEVTGRYNSSIQTIQGIQFDNLYMDLGTRERQ